MLFYLLLYPFMKHSIKASLCVRIFVFVLRSIILLIPPALSFSGMDHILAFDHLQTHLSALPWHYFWRAISGYHHITGTDRPFGEVLPSTSCTMLKPKDMVEVMDGGKQTLDKQCLSLVCQQILPTALMSSRGFVMKKASIWVWITSLAALL